MPTFTSQRPAGIAESFASMMQGNKGLSQTDILNAEKTISGIEHSRASAQNQNALAEKVRLELEQMRNAENMRKDPAMAAEFAARSSGINVPDAQRIEQNFRGESLPPTTPMDDEGNAMPAAPIQVPSNVNPQQLGLYNAARAGLMANNLATGKTNGEQLTKSVGDGQQNSIVGAVQTAIANGDTQRASAMSQGAKPGNAIKLFDDIGSTGATYSPATGAVNATPGSNALIDSTLGNVKAQTNQHNAQAGNANASAGQHRASTDKIRGEIAAEGAGGKLGKAPQGYAWGPLNAEGQPTLRKIEGGPVDVGKQLPHGAVKDLAGAGDAVETTERLSNTFDKKFAGGVPILSELKNTYLRVTGDDTGRAQWWQDMDALQNQTRHALFGSALTKTELAAWNKTSVTPAMDAKQIEQNLARRTAIEARAASKLGRAYESAGYNKQQIQELLGVGAQYLNNAAPPVDKQNPKGGGSGSWGGSAVPAGWSITKVEPNG